MIDLTLLDHDHRCACTSRCLSCCSSTDSCCGLFFIQWWWWCNAASCDDDVELDYLKVLLLLFDFLCFMGVVHSCCFLLWPIVTHTCCTLPTICWLSDPLGSIVWQWSRAVVFAKYNGGLNVLQLQSADFAVCLNPLLCIGLQLQALEQWSLRPLGDWMFLRPPKHDKDIASDISFVGKE